MKVWRLPLSSLLVFHNPAGHKVLSDEVSPGTLLAMATPDPNAEHSRVSTLVQKCHPTMCLSDDNVLFEVASQQVFVAALAFFPQLASLVVGYNFGAFQIINLSTLTIDCASPYEESMPPVLSFACQEPENDPKNFVYLWLCRSWTSEGGREKSKTGQGSRALCTMYAMNYDSKVWIEGHGLWYQGLASISPRFEFDILGGLGLRGQPVEPSRVFSALTVQLSTPPSAAGAGGPSPVGALTASDEDSGSVLEQSLCLFGWVGGVKDKGYISLNHYLAVFDINQWYQAHMPSSLKLEESHLCPYMSFHLLDRVPGINADGTLSEVVMGAIPKPASWAQHTSHTCNDSDWFPAALSYGHEPYAMHSSPDALVLTSDSLVEYRCQSAQQAALALLTSCGPAAIVNPEEAHAVCVFAGLIPSDPHHHLPPSSASPMMLEREALLNVSLDQQLVSLLVQCVTEFSEGRFTNLGCSLPSLLDWAWGRVTEIKTSNDNLCLLLFDPDCGVMNSENIALLHQNLTNLTTLATIITTIRDSAQSNLITLQGANELEGRVKVVRLMVLHLEAVLWFYHCGLLSPTPIEDPGDECCVPFPAELLSRIYRNRRSEIKNLSASLTGNEVLMIDGLLEEAAEVSGGNMGQAWEEEGGTSSIKSGGVYPPPSLHGLLNMFLLPYVPTTTKHRIVQYLFLDLASLLSDGYDDAALLQDSLRGGLGTARRRHGTRSALVHGYLTHLPDVASRLSSGVKRPGPPESIMYKKPPPLSAQIRQSSANIRSRASALEEQLGSPSLHTDPYTPFRSAAQRRRAYEKGDLDDYDILVTPRQKGSSRDASHVVFPSMETSPALFLEGETSGLFSLGPGRRSHLAESTHIGDGVIKIMESVLKRSSMHNAATPRKSMTQTISADMLSLLQTPKIRRKRRPDTRSGPDDTLTDTPQSILKVRQMVQRPLSPATASDASVPVFPRLSARKAKISAAAAAAVVEESALNRSADTSLTPKQLRFHLPKVQARAQLRSKGSAQLSADSDQLLEEEEVEEVEEEEAGEEEEMEEEEAVEEEEDEMEANTPELEEQVETDVEVTVPRLESESQRPEKAMDMQGHESPAEVSLEEEESSEVPSKETTVNDMFYSFVEEEDEAEKANTEKDSTIEQEEVEMEDLEGVEISREIGETDDDLNTEDGDAKISEEEKQEDSIEGDDGKINEEKQEDSIEGDDGKISDEEKQEDSIEGDDATISEEKNREDSIEGDDAAISEENKQENSMPEDTSKMEKQDIELESVSGVNENGNIEKKDTEDEKTSQRPDKSALSLSDTLGVAAAEVEEEAEVLPTNQESLALEKDKEAPADFVPVKEQEYGLEERGEGPLREDEGFSEEIEPPHEEAQVPEEELEISDSGREEKEDMDHCITTQEEEMIAEAVSEGEEELYLNLESDDEVSPILSTTEVKTTDNKKDKDEQVATEEMEVDIVKPEMDEQDTIRDQRPTEASLDDERSQESLPSVKENTSVDVKLSAQESSSAMDKDQEMAVTEITKSTIKESTGVCSVASGDVEDDVAAPKLESEKQSEQTFVVKENDGVSLKMEEINESEKELERDETPISSNQHKTQNDMEAAPTDIEAPICRQEQDTVDSVVPGSKDIPALMEESEERMLTPSTPKRTSRSTTPAREEVEEVRHRRLSGASTSSPPSTPKRTTRSTTPSREEVGEASLEMVTRSGRKLLQVPTPHTRSKGSPGSSLVTPRRRTRRTSGSQEELKAVSQKLSLSLEVEGESEDASSQQSQETHPAPMPSTPTRRITRQSHAETLETISEDKEVESTKSDVKARTPTTPSKAATRRSRRLSEALETIEENALLTTVEEPQTPVTPRHSRRRSVGLQETVTTSQKRGRRTSTESLAEELSHPKSPHRTKRLSELSTVTPQKRTPSRRKEAQPDTPAKGAINSESSEEDDRQTRRQRGKQQEGKEITMQRKSRRLTQASLVDDANKPRRKSMKVYSLSVITLKENEEQETEAEAEAEVEMESGSEETLRVVKQMTSQAEGSCCRPKVKIKRANRPQGRGKVDVLFMLQLLGLFMQT
ncbi:Protein ELYS [Portunus trituberculatus]|uniref:Protein ELYS n=1 Tax=Portunus trituberculatus TaxID=210409 RepID=A0A5B7D6G6_PORTR|nr:Protein ELYS [Portunus trituberculatus]